MPYICLARNDIPDGTLQVLDLWPNTSQRNSSIDPPGQTRYVNRTRRTALAVSQTLGTVSGGVGVRAADGFLTGLEAYLLDRVEPGATQQATADITLAGIPNALDTIIINGVIHVEFTAAASDATTAATVGAPLLVNIKGSAALSADELTVVMVNAAAIVTMRGLNANIFPDVSNVGALVTMDADFTGGGGQLGVTGDMSLSLTGAGVAGRITLPVPARLARTNEDWTEALLTVAAASLQASVDAGTALTAAIVNGAGFLGDVGADIAGAAASSASTGTLLELLSVLSGRAYRMASDSLKFTAVTAPDTIHVWDATQRGGFTVATTVFDSQMLQGEIRPNAPFTKTKNINAFSQANQVTGGTVQNNELGDVRYTAPVGSAEASLQGGALSRMQDGTVTLFPDSDFSVFHGANANLFQPGPQTAEVAAARLVTVYADDGSLL